MGPDADYSRPALWTISNGAPFLIGNPSGSRNSMYYAFYGCETELNPGIPGGTPYYPVYIVDGMSDYLEFGLSGVSYINDFVNTITNSSASRAQIKTESGKCFTYTNAIIATNASIINCLYSLIGFSNFIHSPCSAVLTTHVFLPTAASEGASWN